MPDLVILDLEWNSVFSRRKKGYISALQRPARSASAPQR